LAQSSALCSSFGFAVLDYTLVHMQYSCLVDERLRLTVDHSFCASSAGSSSHVGQNLFQIAKQDLLLDLILLSLDIMEVVAQLAL
jgi:hypothetical protein